MAGIKNQKYCCSVVRGTRRSCAPAVTSAIATANGTPPIEVTPANENYPRGHWESSRLSQINNAMLASAGICWIVAERIDQNCLGMSDRPNDAVCAADLICLEFLSSRLIVLIDPRINRFLPIWEMTFELLEGQWFPELAARKRSCVASALLKRAKNEKFTPATGGSTPLDRLMWVQYNLDDEVHSREMWWPLFDYKVLLDDCCSVLKSLASFGIISVPSIETVKLIKMRPDLALNREGRSNVPGKITLHLDGGRAADAVRIAIIVGNSPKLDAFRSHPNRLSDPAQVANEGRFATILEQLDTLEPQP